MSFLELRTPRDLLEKAHREHHRLQSKPGRRVAESLRRLNRQVRLVFDYLLIMTDNARRPSPAPAAPLPAAPAPA